MIGRPCFQADNAEKRNGIKDNRKVQLLLADFCQIFVFFFYPSGQGAPAGDFRCLLSLHLLCSNTHRRGEGGADEKGDTEGGAN